LIETATLWCTELFSKIVTEDIFAYATIGGSVAKGQSDADSDVDLSIICDDMVNDAVHQYILTYCDVFFHTQDLYGVQLAIQVRDDVILDVHLIRNSDCRSRVSSFNQGNDLSSQTQDFLWNLSNGVVCCSIGISPVYEIIYSNKIKDKLLC
jgi:predicted nucleotidyltransferase